MIYLKIMNKLLILLILLVSLYIVYKYKNYLVYYYHKIISVPFRQHNSEKKDGTLTKYDKNVQPNYENTQNVINKNIPTKHNKYSQGKYKKRIDNIDEDELNNISQCSIESSNKGNAKQYNSSEIESLDLNTDNLSNDTLFDV